MIINPKDEIGHWLKMGETGILLKKRTHWTMPSIRSIHKTDF